VCRNITKFKDAIKTRIKGPASDYSKLEMDEEDDLGLELGLGGISGLKKSDSHSDSFDELNRLIM
jgi:hypothetical protein